MPEENVVKKVKEMKLLNGAEAITKAINSIQTRGKKLDRDIHVAGCSCIKHMQEHGDITLAVRLIDSMPNGSRVNALRAWFEAYSVMYYDTDLKKWKFSKSKESLLQDAMETSWTSFKPEPAYKPMNLMNELTSLLKKAYDRVEDTKGDAIDLKMLNKVSEAVGYKSE